MISRKAVIFKRCFPDNVAHVMETWIDAEDNPHVTELQITDDFEEDLESKTRAGSSEDDVATIPTPAEVIDHGTGIILMHQLSSYVRSHDFPSHIASKAESLFADVRKHTNKRKLCTQQVLTAFVNVSKKPCNVSNNGR